MDLWAINIIIIIIINIIIIITTTTTTVTNIAFNNIDSRLLEKSTKSEVRLDVGFMGLFKLALRDR